MHLKIGQLTSCALLWVFILGPADNPAESMSTVSTLTILYLEVINVPENTTQLPWYLIITMQHQKCSFILLF